MYRIILTNRDLNGFVASEESVIEDIQKLNSNTIGMCSYLNTYKEKNRVAFIGVFLEFCMENLGFRFDELKSNEFWVNPKYAKVRDIIAELTKSETELVSTQGLLLLLKYLYIYKVNIQSVEGQLNFILDRNQLAYLISTQLKINDLIQIEVKDSDLLHWMMIKFSNEMNLKGLLSRTWYVYCKLALEKDKLGIKNKQFLDFNFNFANEYQFEIEELLAVYFYMYNQFYCNFEVTPYIDTSNFFDKAKFADKSNQILKTLVCSSQDFKAYAEKSISKTFDFEVLTNTPLLEVSDNIAIVPSKSHLQAYLLNNFRKKMENLYEAGGNKFSQFLGFPFETYVQELCEYSILGSNIIGKKEFTIVGNYKSSEYYMRQQNTMMVIEVKSKDIPREKIFSNYDSNMVYGLVTDQFVNPVFQIDRSIQAILGSEHSPLFKGITDIIAVIVTYENTHLSIETYQNYAISEINNEKDSLKTEELKYFLNFGIEEFECLCWLFETKYDVFEILKEYSTKTGIPFYNFLTGKGIEFQVIPKLVDENWTLLNKRMSDYFIG